jgi:hypothetical protein
VSYYRLPDDPDEPEHLAHYVTIRAVVPLAPTDPVGWNLEALLDHLASYPEQIHEVTSLRLIPEPDEEKLHQRYTELMTETDDAKPF